MEIRALIAKVQQRKEVALVVGLGVSGVATARFLSGLGIGVRCIERSSEVEFVQRSKLSDSLVELRAAGVQALFGVVDGGVRDHLEGVGVCVLSPGVNLGSSLVKEIQSAGIPLLSELELGVAFLGSNPVVVTGSNGKSTTVALIKHMLDGAKISSILCGNFGSPVVSFVEGGVAEARVDPRVLIVEASSYQLELCTGLKPKVGVFLNLSENHLERHGTMQRYFEAKANLFAHQSTSDYAVINIDDEWGRLLAAKVSGRVVPIGEGVVFSGSKEGARIEYAPEKGIDRIVLRLDGRTEEYECGSAALLGGHNRYDMAAAVCAARISGVPREVCTQGLLTFAPLEHRCEVVGTSEGITLINDSKATTVAAARSALCTILAHFQGRPVGLMLGGQAKAGSWEPLMVELRRGADRLLPVVCFGGDGKKLKGECDRAGVPAVLGGKVEDALGEAVAQARGRGAVILFSPGCASFDEFRDFEERGRRFKLVAYERYLGA